MEVTIANWHDSSLSVAELKKDGPAFRKNVNFSISSSKEAMNIFKAGPIRIRPSKT